MNTLETTATPVAAATPLIRRIGEADLNWALAEGWSDFKDRRGELLVLAMIYPVVGLLAAAAAFDARFLPVFFPVVAGISILGPAVASGFYELARRREAGLDSGWMHFLDPLNGRSRWPLGILTVGLAGLFAAWLGAATVIYDATLGAGHVAGTADFFTQLFTTGRGWTMILAGNFVGLLFAVATLALSLVSFPLVVDKGVDPTIAVAASIEAVRKNPREAAAWGLRVAGLLLIACLPLFVGLAIVLPLLGYATWHLYTRLVER